jgi:Bacterial PH domain
MYKPLRAAVLKLLKVPHEPQPPAGDPSSLRVFHAGINYYRLRLARWSVAQILALAGIVFWTSVLIDVERNIALERAGAATAVTAGVNGPPSAATSTEASSKSAGREVSRRHPDWPVRLSREFERLANEHRDGANPGIFRNVTSGWHALKTVLVEVGSRLPPQAFPLLWGIKIISFALYLLQIPLTYAVRRLDYELRWYMVTDRSLRLRSGVWKIAESTMSFANLQQVEVSQGPLQRLLGLADVKVQSAGGGEKRHQPQQDEMHVGYFRSVTNAPEIRDLILDLLRRFRDSGLGDPDEKSPPAPALEPRPASGPLEAARELLAETCALRDALRR